MEETGGGDPEAKQDGQADHRAGPFTVHEKLGSILFPGVNESCGFSISGVGHRNSVKVGERG